LPRLNSMLIPKRTNKIIATIIQPRPPPERRVGDGAAIKGGGGGTGGADGA
jgi:hypothetical protein